jgi:hypothetical protein
MSFCFEGSISFLRTGFKEKQLFWFKVFVFVWWNVRILFKCI